ncbi:MAG: SDR family oxidoreductase [Nitrospirae bacterium]|nr:SDR family oxidoreductase [Nitrospirota bacterium]MBU6480404.1 SDR family oxidoreductase [Nitrospirota bacterium]MDE3039802.1 SDR family oxidoreductase [Nitrospirota bacterium]MDE3051556.1 SDR family oxidoreductase [Nitrospirota bacterium]MDE3220829.1 SDR family oxidoreductase [Nitrospirota bacterium]
MSAEDKVVLITGASGALGQTVVPSFVATGARVIAADRHPLSIQVEGCRDMKADVTDEADVRRLVDEVIRTAGRIDALINLVGGFAVGRVVESDASLWHRMLTMNLTAAFLLSKAVLPHMMERRTGRIVHVAARAALEPFPGAAAYIVSKSGLVALIRALSLELAGSGVTVNGVLPATIDTPANRSNMPDADPSKWARPESIAQTLIFLASKEASQINGALIPIG